MKTLRLMWPWLRRRWRRLAWFLLLAVITVLAGVGLLSVAGSFLTSAFLAGSLITFDLFAPSALVRGFSFLRIVARYAERVVGHAATLDLLADMRTAVFSRVMGLSPVQLAQYQEADLAARLVGDIDALDTLFLLVIAPIATALVIGLAFSAVVGWYVPTLALIVFMTLATGACVVPFVLARWSGAPGAQVQQAAGEARALIHDVMASHADVAVFCAQAHVRAQFQVTVARLSQARDRVSAIGSAGQCAQQVMMGVCLMALLWLGLRAFQAGVLGGPVWVGLLLAALGLFEILDPSMRGAARLGMTAAAGVRVRALLDAEPALVDMDSPLALPSSGVLELAAIRYHYPGPPRGHVLDGLNLRVEPGEHIAIVGVSGSGKSTLLSLIMRLFDPDSGMISYGGVPISKVKLAELHRRFTLLSQRSPVFLGTVRSNLLIGDSSATDRQLWQALEDAGLACFVRSFSVGLDMWVGESGSDLSLGQARRLCLARALLTSATVWVLDEPTAGLDTDAQAAFFSDLRRAAAGRTVVLATHAEIPPGGVDRVLSLSSGILHDGPARYAPPAD